MDDSERMIGKKRSAGRPATARKRGHVSLSAAPSPVRAPGIERSPDCELINSLARGLQVLAVFGPQRMELGNKEISALTAIPKPSVSRLTDTLVKLNFLGQNGDNGLYRLGPAALALGVSALPRQDLASVAKPFAAEFAALHQVNVTLGMLDGLEARVSLMSGVDTAAGIRTALGASFPLDRTALGFALLAGLDDHEYAQISDRLARDQGKDWPEAEQRIGRALQQYRGYGYCTMLGEWGGTMNSLAAPLLVDNLSGRLAIGCSAPGPGMTEERRLRLAPYFVGLVETIRAAARQQFPSAPVEGAVNIRDVEPAV